MKLIQFPAVFVCTFLLGIYAAGPGIRESVLFTPPSNEISVFDPAEPRDIEVRYLGLYSEAQDIGTVSLIFSIRNGTNAPLSYVGYTKGHSFPLFKAGDVGLPGPNFCSRGTSRYVIPPGGSAKLRVAREEFPENTPENEFVSVGFRLRSGAETSSVAYFSKPFILPEGFLLTADSN